MSALDELLDLDNWRNDTSCYPSTAWYFTGDIDPKDAVAELEEWRAELDKLNDLASDMADAISNGDDSEASIAMQHYYEWLREQEKII